MRIDKLEIKNFKKFADQTIELHHQFNLLVGDNGSGKTTILDALAVALGIWMVDRPEPALKQSQRKISDNNIRLVSYKRGDRLQFEESHPVILRATGQMLGQAGLIWTRHRYEESGETSEDAGDVLALIRSCFMRSKQGVEILCPILAYYGAQRGSDSIQFKPKQLVLDYIVGTVQHSREQMSRSGFASLPQSSRWAAFYRCLHPEINFARTLQWFVKETLEAGNRQGRPRPGFEVVRRAILRCVPGADAVFYSVDRDQIVLSVQGNPQPWHNLSAGQRTMMILVADLAIKAVTQNAHLLPEDVLRPEDELLPRVLRETPGVVLIDELDIHLHPSWQRQVVADLRATFPSIQFVCTSHSPQVIGELSRDEVLLLNDEGSSHPQVARGADSNWILDHVLDGATSENAEARALQQQIEDAIEDGRFPQARGALEQLKQLMEEGLTGELVGLESRLASLEALAEVDGTDEPGEHP